MNEAIHKNYHCGGDECRQYAIMEIVWNSAHIMPSLQFYFTLLSRISFEIIIWSVNVFFFGNFIFFCSHTTTRWFSLLSCSIGNENKNMLRISVFIVTIVAYAYMWWSHHKESCSSWLLLVKKINIILQIIFKLFW